MYGQILPLEGQHLNVRRLTPRAHSLDHSKQTHSAGRLGEATVGGDLGLETGALSRGKIGHAGVIGVVHEVVETVDHLSQYVTLESCRLGGLRIL